MEKKELTCICCPMGCALSVEMDGNQVMSVSGNTVVIPAKEETLMPEMKLFVQ